MQLNLPEHDPIELNEFYCYVLITFIESGTYSWFEVSKYKYYLPSLGKDPYSAKPFIINDAECANVYGTFSYEYKDSEGYSKGIELNQNTINEAFKRLFSGPIVGLHENYRFDLIKAWINLEAGDIDCDMADILMQIYCYNEIVFS